MKKIIYFILISSISFSLFLGVASAQETCSGTCKAACGTGETSPGTLNCIAPTPVCCVASVNNEAPPSGFGFEKVNNVASQAGYNPGNEPTLDERISSIISTFLSFLGVIFMLLMIYGGFNWMTAEGDEQKVERAKDTIRAAVIGLVIVIAAYAISIFAISKIWGAGESTISSNQ